MFIKLDILYKFFFANSVFFSVFPFISFTKNSNYTQPYAFLFAIFSIVLYFTFQKKIYICKHDILSLILFALLGFILIIYSNLKIFNLQEVKYLLNYLAPLVYFITFKLCLEKNKNLFIIIIQISLILWYCVALVQLYFSPAFALNLLGTWADSAVDIINSGRGVCSLAPEPWYHAAMIVLMTTAILLLRFNILWAFLAWINILFLSKSASAMVCMSLGLLTSFMCNGKILKKLSYFTMLGVALFSVNLMYEKLSIETRIFHLFKEILQNPILLLENDYSLNARFGGIFSAIYLPLSNLLIPFGISHEAWLVAREQVLESQPWIIDLSEVGVASGLGLILFQAGFLSYFIFVFIFKKIFSTHLSFLNQAFLFASLFIICFQFSISSPAFWLVIACVDSKRCKDLREKKLSN